MYLDMSKTYDAEVILDMDRERQFQLSKGLLALAWREQLAHVKRAADTKLQTQAAALGGEPWRKQW